MHKHVNLPSFLLLSFLIRQLVTGASFGDALVIIALSALYGWHMWMDSKKDVPVNKNILNKLTELEESLKVTKEKVNSINLGASLRK